MKRAKILAIAVLAVGLLSSCSKKFSPDESAVLIGKEGDITAAVIDTLDESYYNSEELKENVEASVASYNSSAGGENIEIDKFEIEEGNVKLFMKYASYTDYKEFNNVDFYVGDITDAYNNGGYRFETTFQEVENGEVIRMDIEREEIFAGVNHSMMIFYENMEVEVPGKILYASSNVEVTGKKSAKMVDPEADDEAETQSEEAQSEGSSEIMEIEPVVETKDKNDTENNEGKHLAYIIYE